MSEGGVIPIRVVVRVRPQSEKEIREGSQIRISCDVEHNQITCIDKTFAFDAIFDPKSSQDDVFFSAAGVLIDKIFQGYNCTIVAYGQTGSGKTFTMGTEETINTMHSNRRGIVPRIVERIFEIINESPSKESFAVSVSMLEVYDDKVIDLLSRCSNRDGLPIREKDGVPFVQGLSEESVGSLTSTMSQLERGCSLRSKGETAMNAVSSRSHAVFTVTLTKTASQDDESFWKAKLRLVDLAGSERLKKTMAVGNRAKEGIKINEGLSALGNVIQALSSQEKHIPYRDSKITRLLQDSLGGNSYTVMIACVSPADSNTEETLSTLRYADRVKSIKNTPTLQIDPQTAELKRLREENAALRLEVAAYRAGETPDQIVCIDKEITVAKESKAMPLGMNIPSTSYCPSPMTPRRIVRKDDYDEVVKRCDGFEKIISALKEKISELIVMKLNLCDENTEKDAKIEKMTTQLETVTKMLNEEMESTEEGDLKVKLMEMAKASTVQIDENETRDDDESHLDCTEGEEEEMDEDKMNIMLRKTEVLSREVDQIEMEIQAKQRLAEQSCAELKKFSEMEHEHKREMSTLQERLTSLQSERDALQEQLKRIGVSSKLAEERRRRLQEVEKELSAQRKKLNELKNMEKLKKVSDETVQRLKHEISEMKQLRVRMTKQLRAETNRYKQCQLIAERKIAQLQQKDRKRENEAAKLKQTLGQQLVVARRKYEEAAAANKRLQQQMTRVEKAKGKREKKGTINQEELQEALIEDIELIVSVKTAERHSEELIAQRKKMNKYLEGLERRLKEMKSEEGRNEKDIDRLEEDRIETKEGIERNNATIQSLQSKCSSFDMKEWEDSRFGKLDETSRKLMIAVFNAAVESRMNTVEEEKEKKDKEARMKEEIEKAKGRLREAEREAEMERNKRSSYIRSLSKDSLDYAKKLSTITDTILGSEKVEMTNEMMDVIKKIHSDMMALERMNSSTHPVPLTRTRRSVRRQGYRDPLEAISDDDDNKTMDVDPADRTYVAGSRSTGVEKNEKKESKGKRKVTRCNRFPSPIHGDGLVPNTVTVRRSGDKTGMKNLGDKENLGSEEPETKKKHGDETSLMDMLEGSPSVSIRNATPTLGPIQ